MKKETLQDVGFLLIKIFTKKFFKP